MQLLGFLLPLLFVVAVHSASIFDAITFSVGNLFTEKDEAPFSRSGRAIKGFEERVYEALNWVCANESDIKDADKSQEDTFLQLLSYLEGENANSIEINMAIPVSIEFRHDSDTGNTTLKACFFLGGDHQNNPPVPTNKNLTISTSEPMTIYTRKFGGLITSPAGWLKEAKKLQGIVAKAGKLSRGDLMFWNAFDSPAKFWNRRNEVWLVKEEEL